MAMGYCTQHGMISDCCFEIRKGIDCCLCIHNIHNLEKKRQERIKRYSQCLCAIGFASQCCTPPELVINTVATILGLKESVAIPIAGVCVGYLCGDFYNLACCEPCNEIWLHYCDQIVNNIFVDQYGKRPERPLLTPKLQEMYV